MSFFTSFKYFSPEPQRVTTRKLAQFIERIAATGVLEGKGLFLLNVKFGKAVDQDDLPTMFEQEDGDFIRMREISWDLNSDVKRLDDVVHALGEHDEIIYRAHVMLGGITNSVSASISRVKSPQNEGDLCPDSWSISMGPVDVCLLDWDGPVTVGWMSMDVSGYGYLYPWNFRQWVQKAQANEKINDVCELVRRTWPCSMRQPIAEQLKIREKMGPMWLNSIDAPVDWAWGCSETG